MESPLFMEEAGRGKGVSEPRGEGMRKGGGRKTWIRFFYAAKS